MQRRDLIMIYVSKEKAEFYSGDGYSGIIL